MASVKEFVEKRLKLKVNMQKSAVDRPVKRKFLGFSFTLEKEPRIRLAPKSLERIKQKIRQLTARSWGISMEERLEKLKSQLNGWIAYFSLIETPSTLRSLDEWIRRRLRMCCLKQWKRPKTIRKNLIALGIKEEWARKISGSRKGYWRLACTPQVNKALGLQYWKDQGLISLVEKYQQLRVNS